MALSIGNASKGLKALKDVFKKGENGIITSAKTGAQRLKPGYGEVAGKEGVQKLGGIGNTILRNPKISLAAAGAGLAGGAYFLGGSSSAGAAGGEGASANGGGYSAQA